MKKTLLTVGMIIGLAAVACELAPPDIDTPPVPNVENPSPAATQPNVTIVGTVEVEHAEGEQRVTFNLADGSEIVGSFYPPRVSPAPGILLVHQIGMDRLAWLPMVEVLQGNASRSTGVGQETDPNYAVFSFDLPDHGESAGDGSDEAIIAATKQALDLFRTMPGVDPDRIVIMGASVGADAAALLCREGCIGAISVSPGGYLEIQYTTELMGMDTRPALCIASKGDVLPYTTCEKGNAAARGKYQIQIYDGDYHGNWIILQNAIIKPDPQPVPLIMEWLALNAPLK